MAEYRKVLESKEYRDSIPKVPAHETRKCSLKISDIDMIMKNKRPCAGKFDKSCKEREVTDEDAQNLARLYKSQVDTEENSFDEIDFDKELQEILASTVGDDDKLHHIKPVFQKSTSIAKTGLDFPSPVFASRRIAPEDPPPKKVPAYDQQPSTSTNNQQSGQSNLMMKINDSFRKSNQASSSVKEVVAKPQLKIRNPTVNQFQPMVQQDRKPLYESTQGSNTIEVPMNPCPDFSSAKSTLKVQNMQKYGNADGIRQKCNVGTASTQPAYHPVKSLGGKYRQLNSCREQFKPPSQTNDDKPQPMDIEEIEDDPLLKGIEPHILDIIKREVVVNIKDVKWEQIAGLESAKQTIQEAIMLPLTSPQLFVGLRTIPKGILLFGPPGTGKTLIGEFYNFVN